MRQRRNGARPGYGHRTVKQYDKSKEDIEKVTRQQTEKLKSIPDDEKDERK